MLMQFWSSEEPPVRTSMQRVGDTFESLLGATTTPDEVDEVLLNPVCLKTSGELRPLSREQNLLLRGLWKVYLAFVGVLDSWEGSSLIWIDPQDTPLQEATRVDTMVCQVPLY